MDKKDKRRIIIPVIFILLFLIRLIAITHPPLDYSSWRQVDTDSIARNFIEYKFNIFYPQLNYDGPMPNYVQLELQVTTFIIAILYKIFGVNPVIGRAVPIVFFMGSCYYLYRLVKRKSGINAAFITVLIYGLLPINLVYSRNIMPESALMFFMIGGINYFDRWIESGSLKYYLLAVIFTALTILTKLPGGFIGIPMIYLAFRKYRMKALKNLKLILFPVFALGIPYLYFVMLGRIAEQKFVSGIGTTLILPNFLNSIFQKETARYLTEQFALKVFTIPGIILFSFGIVCSKRKDEYFYYAWLLAAALHIVLIDAVIHLDYYLMFLTPVISVFMAHACIKLFESKRYMYFLYISIAIIALNDTVMLKEINKLQSHYITLGNYVAQYTDPGDLIIIDRDSPELFYTSGRKGWRMYGNLLAPQYVEGFMAEGADYFVQSTQLEGSLTNYLDRNFQKISLPDGNSIYKLTR